MQEVSFFYKIVYQKKYDPVAMFILKNDSYPLKIVCS
jgi:hypothetical protein